MENLLRTADHASQQSDRWLFIATLIVMGIFAMLVARFFIRQYQLLVEDHRRDRETYQTSLQSIISQQNNMVKEMAVLVERNTEALHDVSIAMKWCESRTRIYEKPPQ